MNSSQKLTKLKRLFPFEEVYLDMAGVLIPVPHCFMSRIYHTMLEVEVCAQLL